MDGMATAITNANANAMEQYQKMQAENDLGASMYGPANPSGMFDFVLKRPTEKRTGNLYLEQDSSSMGQSTAMLEADWDRTRSSAIGRICSSAMAPSL